MNSGWSGEEVTKTRPAEDYGDRQERDRFVDPPTRRGVATVKQVLRGKIPGNPGSSHLAGELVLGVLISMFSNLLELRMEVYRGEGST